MGRAARPLHDPGNHRSIERGSNLQAARRGGLMKPAKPAGERENTAALTPSLGTRSVPQCARQRQRLRGSISAVFGRKSQSYRDGTKCRCDIEAYQIASRRLSHRFYNLVTHKYMVAVTCDSTNWRGALLIADDQKHSNSTQSHHSGS